MPKQIAPDVQGLLSPTQGKRLVWLQPQVTTPITEWKQTVPPLPMEPSPVMEEARPQAVLTPVMQVLWMADMTVLRPEPVQHRTPGYYADSNREAKATCCCGNKRPKRMTPVVRVVAVVRFLVRAPIPAVIRGQATIPKAVWKQAVPPLAMEPSPATEEARPRVVPTPVKQVLWMADMTVLRPEPVPLRTPVTMPTATNKSNNVRREQKPKRMTPVVRAVAVTRSLARAPIPAVIQGQATIPKAVWRQAVPPLPMEPSPATEEARPQVVPTPVLQVLWMADMTVLRPEAVPLRTPVTMPTANGKSNSVVQEQYAKADDTGCTSCATGTVSIAGSDSCVNPNTGHYSNNGIEKDCTSIDDSTWKANTGVLSTDTCPFDCKTGYVKDSQSCRAARQGYYADGGAEKGCASITGGTYFTPQGGELRAAACDFTCAVGKVKKTDSRRCDDPILGTYVDGNVQHNCFPPDSDSATDATAESAAELSRRGGTAWLGTPTLHCHHPWKL